VALGVAAKLCVERGRAQRRPVVDQAHEAHESEPRAEFDQGETEIPMKLAAHLRGSSAQAQRELEARDVGRGNEMADGPTTAHVGLAGSRAERREQITQHALDRAVVTHVTEGESAFTEARHLGAGKDDLVLEQVGATTANPIGERRTQRDDEELEIGARVEEHVILSRLEHDELSGAELERPITNAERGRAANDGIHLGFLVEMARTAVLRLVPPELRGVSRQHGERLKEGGRHGYQDGRSEPSRRTGLGLAAICKKTQSTRVAASVSWLSKRMVSRVIVVATFCSTLAVCACSNPKEASPGPGTGGQSAGAGGNPPAGAAAGQTGASPGGQGVGGAGASSSGASSGASGDAGYAGGTVGTSGSPGSAGSGGVPALAGSGGVSAPAGSGGAAAGGSSVGGGSSSEPFVLAWQDEFDALDSSAWQLQTFTWDGNQSTFSTQNASVADGVLTISLTAAPSGAEKPYLGVEMRSVKTLTYGKVSARMRFATGSGVVSGLVLFYTPYPNCDWNEIDIEHLGKSSNSSQMNAQVYTGTPDPSCTTSVTPTQDPQVVDLGFNAETDFHLYDIEWTPAGVKYFADGVLLRTWTAEIGRLKLPETILLTIWASNSADWAGALTSASAPTTAQVDWIKVYDYKADASGM
jgi:endo-1,3-1,4-beta-glycanase ExoK